MNEQLLPRVVAKMVFPFIIVFALYVVTHGELGPGGGFQGGVILASAFITYGLIFGADKLQERVPPWTTDFLAAFGVLLYAGTGLATLFLGGRFLDYGQLNPDKPGDAEALGMTLVEYGVGITVASVMIIIYNQITEPDSGTLTLAQAEGHPTVENDDQEGEST